MGIKQATETKIVDHEKKIMKLKLPENASDSHRRKRVKA